MNKLPHVKKKLCLISTVLLTFSLVACQTTDEVAEKTVEPALLMCLELRPQMCTMEYMPVCGSKIDASTKTYGNACGACADIEVSGYVVGACEANDEQ